jgi:hypothetical protein
MNYALKTGMEGVLWSFSGQIEYTPSTTDWPSFKRPWNRLKRNANYVCMCLVTSIPQYTPTGNRTTLVCGSMVMRLWPGQSPTPHCYILLTGKVWCNTLYITHDDLTSSWSFTNGRSSWNYLKHTRTMLVRDVDASPGFSWQKTQTPLRK